MNASSIGATFFKFPTSVYESCNPTIPIFVDSLVTLTLNNITKTLRIRQKCEKFDGVRHAGHGILFVRVNHGF